MFHSHSAVVFLLCSVIVCQLTAESHAFDDLGPFAVGHISRDYLDATRGGRKVTTDIWYPVDTPVAAGETTRYPFPYSSNDTWNMEPLLIAPTESAIVANDGPFPLIVLSHGNVGNVLRLTHLGEGLASHGFLVAAPGHTGNQWHDWRFGTLLDRSTLDRYRPLDISLVIDEITNQNADPEDTLFGHVNLEQIAVAGHSYGGYTALATASGQGTLPHDPRVKSLVLVDSSKRGLNSAELNSIELPTLLIGRPETTGSSAHNEIVDPWLNSVAQKYRIDIPEAAHSSFAYMECQVLPVLERNGAPQELIDLMQDGFFPLSGPDIGPCGPDVLPIGEVQQLTRELVVSFLKLALEQDDRYADAFTPARSNLDSLEILTRTSESQVPVRLLIEDPLGREFGFDPISGEEINELGEGAVFSQINSFRQSYRLPVNEIVSGPYRITGIGTAEGAYSIATRVSEAGDPLTLFFEEEIADGVAMPESVITPFTLQLLPVPEPSSIALTAFALLGLFLCVGGRQLSHV